MKSFISKFLVAVFACALAAAPLTASAANVRIGVNVGGPGYWVHGGYVNRRPEPPPPRYGWYRRWDRVPAPVVYEGYYGPAPGGYYGYYSRGRWFAHRRWGNGFWIYF